MLTISCFVQLELDSVSLSIVGPGADLDASDPAASTAEKFKIIEGEQLAPYLSQ